MRNGFLAALILLASHGFALAQTDPCPIACVEECGTESCGFWGSSEYLLWWMKQGKVPPLAVGGNGVPGSPGTQTLVDDLDFVDDLRQGGRFTLGYDFESSLGIEAGCFFLDDGEGDESVSSSGDPVLGRPYINVATGRPAATLISAPGPASGSLTIGALTSLQGAEANVTANLFGSDQAQLRALGGFRFLNLEDELQMANNSSSRAVRSDWSINFVPSIGSMAVSWAWRRACSSAG